MPDIVSDFAIRATPSQVFHGVTAPAGLDTWWTKTSSGGPRVGELYTLDFGPGYVWRAVVGVCDPPREFELVFTDADPDWVGTKVRFTLEQQGDITNVAFQHAGWPQPTPEYRTSCYCWQMYLRLLRRNLEYGELIPYGERLDA